MLPAAGREAVLAQLPGWFARLSYASDVQVLASEAQAPQGAASAVCALGTAYLPLAELIDLDKERARLHKEQEKLQKEIARSQGKLNNAGFVQKAPAAVVEQERAHLRENEALLARVEGLLRTLS